MYKVVCVAFCVFIDAVVSLAPNIVVIIVDDLGWNDVGFHGSNQIPTPNIDALAFNGLILNHHYTQSTCTPSRAAFLTGKYPIRMGMQGPPLYAENAAGLPLTEKLLPQHLKKFGYVSRLIGKWHLGYYKTEYTPTSRGFDSFFGYYNGFVRYNDSVHDVDTKTWGLDARDNLTRAGHRFQNKYATDIYTEEAVQLIEHHDVSKPLYLQVAHLAVHSGNNGLLFVRNLTENNEKFGYIEDPQRRLFAGVLSAFDNSVGQIVTALKSKNILQNSIILMMSDNGAPTFTTKYNNTSSNWPLRGMKDTLFEGGVRCPAVLWSPFTKANIVLDDMVHLTDWVPTFYAIAGGNVSELGSIDGVNQWDYFTGQRQSSTRKHILVNIDEIKENQAIIVQEWKYIQGNATNKATVSYTGVTGRDSELQYDMNQVIQSPVNKILNNSNRNTEELFWSLRETAKIDESCRYRINAVNDENDTVTAEDFCSLGCLFNIKDDPCEFVNLRENNTEKVNYLLSLLNEYKNELVPQFSHVNYPMADPIYWGLYWTSWQSEIHPTIETGWFLISFIVCSFLLICMYVYFLKEKQETNSYKYL